MRPRLSTFSIALAVALPLAPVVSAQHDATTGQVTFREPRTIVPSMNGGAANVIRAVHDDLMMQRLVRKSDGTTEVVEEMGIAHTWNGQIPGDTYRVMPGERLDITVENQLDFKFTIPELTDMNIIGDNDTDAVKQFIHDSMNVTNLHVHGLHVSPQGFSDNVLLHANFGKKIPYSYQLPPYHAPGTHWYHPHNHGSTALQVTQGMVGALIVGEPPGQNLTPAGWPAVERLILIRANGEETILDPTADLDPALLAMLPENRGKLPSEDMARMFESIQARAPEVANIVAELNKRGQLDRLVKIIEDQLNPPTLTVNGQLNPVDEIAPGQLVRMRLINAGSRKRDYRDYYLEGHDIFLAAVDGINLSSLPLAKDGGPSYDGFVAYNDKRKLTLAPGNRADVYFIAKGVGNFALMADTMPRFGAPPMTSQEILTFEVTEPGFKAESRKSDDELEAELSRFLKALDANLKRLQGVGAYAKGGYLAPFTQPIAAERQFMVFNVQQGQGRPFLINGRSYNEDVSNPGAHIGHATMPGLDDFLGNKDGDGGKGPRGQTPWPIRRGTVEKWTISNQSEDRHPFHIHVNPAFVIGIVENGKPVPETDPRLYRWQDTIDLPPIKKVDGVLVPGSVTVLQRFDDFEGLYVLHCHILQHEDRGMMINVLLMPPDDNDKQGYFAKMRKINDELNKQINN